MERYFKYYERYLITGQFYYIKAISLALPSIKYFLIDISFSKVCLLMQNEGTTPPYHAGFTKFEPCTIFQCIYNITKLLEEQCFVVTVIQNKYYSSISKCFVTNANPKNFLIIMQTIFFGQLTASIRKEHEKIGSVHLDSTCPKPLNQVFFDLIEEISGAQPCDIFKFQVSSSYICSL